MTKTKLTPLLPFFLSALPLSAMADLLNDSHLTLDSRTMYYNNDSRTSHTSQAVGKQLGEGLILTGKSGYTPGTLGFGGNAVRVLGTKLYGPTGNNINTGLFPQHTDGNAPTTSAVHVLPLKPKFTTPWPEQAFSNSICRLSAPMPGGCFRHFIAAIPCIQKISVT